MKYEHPLNQDTIFEHVIPADLTKYGLIPELVGRLPVYASLNELSETVLIEILTKPKINLQAI